MNNEFDFKELVEAVSDATIHDTEEVRAVLKKAFDVTAEKLAKEGRVEYAGIGTFKLVLRKSRKGLLNGQAWETPELNEVEFEPAPHFLQVAAMYKSTQAPAIV